MFAVHLLELFWKFAGSCKHPIRMNCNEMAGDRLTICEQELLYAFMRLVSISANFLLLKFSWVVFSVSICFYELLCNIT